METNLDNEKSLETLLENKQIVGSVIFTEEGIVTLKRYDEPETSPRYHATRPTEHTVLEDMRKVLKARMQHCSDELNKHINDEDVHITRHVISWKGGHFSKTVYFEMQEFVEKAGLYSTKQVKNFASLAAQVIKFCYYATSEEWLACDTVLAKDALFAICLDYVLVNGSDKVM